MKRWLVVFSILLMIVSGSRDYQTNKMIKDLVDEQPGLHIPQSLPGTHVYLSTQMYQWVNDTNLSVTVIHDVPLGYGISGVTHYIKHGTYVILLRWPTSTQQSDYTLLHEWGHVLQMHSGDLVEDRNSDWTWKGEDVDFSIPWALRPWEIQADSLADYHQLRLMPWRQYDPLR
jgi:hypothetical protein